MRQIAALSLIVLISGCLPAKPEVEWCEETIKDYLAAPSTFKLLEVNDTLYDQKMVDEFNKNMREFDKKFDAHFPPAPFSMLSLEYEVTNPFGVPIRKRNACYYGVKEGKLDPNKYLGGDIIYEALRPLGGGG